MHDLLETLDALGDDFHAHVLRKINQRLDDGVGVAVGADRVNEHLVDLDDVDAKLALFISVFWTAGSSRAVPGAYS